MRAIEPKPTSRLRSCSPWLREASERLRLILSRPVSSDAGLFQVSRSLPAPLALLPILWHRTTR